MSNQDRQIEALRWLKQAQYDWRLAQHIVEDFPAASCFTSQQSVEKALKAAILASTVTAPPRTHVIRELVAKIEPMGLVLEKHIKNLDSYYMMSRYPDAIAGESAPYELYDSDEAREVLALAKEALTSISDWLMLQQLVSRADLDGLDDHQVKLPFNADGQMSDVGEETSSDLVERRSEN